MNTMIAKKDPDPGLSALLDISAEVPALLQVISRRDELVDIYTPPTRPQAMATILKGIVDWLTDEPTIEAGTVEDLARAIEKCGDREELRDLSVQVRNLALSYRPDAGRVAMNPLEARVLKLMESV
jgi:hypothetical protein